MVRVRCLCIMLGNTPNYSHLVVDYARDPIRAERRLVSYYCFPLVFEMCLCRRYAWTMDALKQPSVG